MATKSMAKRKQELEAMIRGLLKAFDAKTPIMMDGRAHHRDEIIAVYRTLIAAIDAVQPAETAAVVARMKRKNAAERLRPVERAITLFLRAFYGAKSQSLTNFGLVPEKTRNVSSKTKAAAVLKARATRAARGTMGKKQRLRIKGKVA